MEGGVGRLETVAGVAGLIRRDPIEMEALTGVLATSVSELEGKPLVGSAESGVGHLGMASSMAGLLKAIG